MKERSLGREFRIRRRIGLVIGATPVTIGFLYAMSDWGQPLARVLAVIIALVSAVIMTVLLNKYINPEIHYFYKGKEAYANKDLDVALRYLIIAVNTQSKFHAYEARMLLAKCLMSMGKNDLAIVEFDKVIAVREKDIPAIFWRGMARFRLGDYSGVIVDANEMIHLDPSNADGYALRAIVHHNKAEFEQAIMEANKSLQLKRQNPIGAYALGFSHLSLGHYPEAVNAFDAVVAHDNGFFRKSEVLFNRGKAHFYLKAYGRALEDFDHVIELTPDYMDALFQRGFIHIKMKTLTLAIADYDRVIELEPKGYAAYSNRGIAHYLINDFEKARLDFEQSLAIQENGHAYNNLGDIHLVTGEYVEALVNFQKAYEMKPDLIEASIGLAVGHYLQGDGEKARDIWAGLVKDEPRFEDVEWVVEEHGQHPKMAALIRRFFEAGSAER